MATIVDMDIFDVTTGIIVHQCNNQGRMGAGIALEIRTRFPTVYEKYITAHKMNKLYLGMAQLISVSEGLVVCNLIGQDKYGWGKNFTDYKALTNGLRIIKAFSNIKKLQVYIPYKMSCGLAGGDWDTVLQIIETEIPNAIICKKE